jgi:hypothetical protein
MYLRRGGYDSENIEQTGTKSIFLSVNKLDILYRPKILLLLYAANQIQLPFQS